MEEELVAPDEAEDEEVTRRRKRMAARSPSISPARRDNAAIGANS
jgi:hypothetical protein